MQPTTRRLLPLTFPGGALLFYVTLVAVTALLIGPFEAAAGGDPEGYGIAALLAGGLAAAVAVLLAVLLFALGYVRPRRLPWRFATGFLVGPLVAMSVSFASLWVLVPLANLLTYGVTTETLVVLVGIQFLLGLLGAYGLGLYLVRYESRSQPDPALS